MQEMISALRPVRNRIRRNRFLRGAAFGLAMGFGAAVLTQVIAFFVPLSDRGWLGLACVGAGILGCAAGNALRRVGNRTAAQAADACGLQERAITALEGGEDEIHRLQRQDAREALRQLDMKKIRPGSVRRALWTALCLAAAFGALLAAPNPRDRDAAARKALRQTLEEGLRAVDRAAEEDETGLTEEKRSELRRIMGDLRRELQDSRETADAMVALDRAEQRLEEMRQQTAGDAFAAAEGNNSDAVKNAAGDATGEAEGGQQKSAAGEGESGQQGSAAQTADSSVTGTQAAISALKTAVTPSAQSAARGQRAAQASDGAQNGQNGQTGASSADGTQASDGKGSQSGSAGSNGEGSPGGGAGTGSTNLEQGAGGQNKGSHAAGNRDPQYKEETYETIYDPERAEAATRDETTNQHRLGDDGSVQTEAGPGRGSLSGDVPWGEVLREYADTEARAAERENLTTRERQWVTAYFSLLTEQRGNESEQ